MSEVIYFESYQGTDLNTLKTRVDRKLESYGSFELMAPSPEEARKIGLHFLAQRYPVFSSEDLNGRVLTISKPRGIKNA